MKSFTPDALDILVRERLEWASRFASAITHDMGNLALIASILEADKSNIGAVDHKTMDLQHGLLTQIRTVIDAVSLWRSDAAATTHPCLLKDWWFVHGRMVRQFLPETVRVSVQNDDGGFTIDAARFNRIIAAVFIAICAQSRALERIKMVVGRNSHQHELVAGISVHAASVMSPLRWPLLLRHDDATLERSSDESPSCELTLRMPVA